MPASCTKSQDRQRTYAAERRVYPREPASAVWGSCDRPPLGSLASTPASDFSRNDRPGDAPGSGIASTLRRTIPRCRYANSRREKMPAGWQRSQLSTFGTERDNLSTLSAHRSQMKKSPRTGEDVRGLSLFLSESFEPGRGKRPGELSVGCSSSRTGEDVREQGSLLHPPCQRLNSWT